jgi:quinol monooxygenase YgiN
MEIHEMGDRISWWVELAVKPGQLDNFRALTAEMTDTTRRERGVLSYQRFVSDDCKFIHVYERYVDSAAAVAHLRQFREEFREKNPSHELKVLLDGFGATYLKPFGDIPYCA